MKTSSQQRLSSPMPRYRFRSHRESLQESRQQEALVRTRVLVLVCVWCVVIVRGLKMMGWSQRCCSP